MAPEEQMTTRWPSWWRLTAVSTIVERVDRRGSCVFSSTMDEVPSCSQRLCAGSAICALVATWLGTELDDYSEMLLHLGSLSHGYSVEITWSVSMRKSSTVQLSHYSFALCMSTQTLSNKPQSSSTGRTGAYFR